MQDREEMIATLEMLVERSAAFDEAIKDIDHQIERAVHAVAGGTDDIGHAMGVLTERRNAQLGRMFELGKTTAQIEDLENRIQELDEQRQEQQAVREWETAAPAAHEDHLDWLRPALDRVRRARAGQIYRLVETLRTGENAPIYARRSF